jgi:hypothetical protein
VSFLKDFCEKNIRELSNMNLRERRAHYIKCIKPELEKKKNSFVEEIKKMREENAELLSTRNDEKRNALDYSLQLINPQINHFVMLLNGPLSKNELISFVQLLAPPGSQKTIYVIKNEDEEDDFKKEKNQSVH